MAHALIGLDLHGRPLRRLPDTHIERLLDLLGAALTPAQLEEEGVGKFLTAYRNALATGTESQIHESGETLFTRCEEAITRLRTHGTTLETDLADLLNIFREMAVTVSGEGAESATDVKDSAARFAVLAQVHDVRLLKQRLQQEVVQLREVAQAHEQRWQAVVEGFSARVNALETQLTTTQHEASCDALTGIANRRAFDEKLLAAVRSHAHCFALAVVDLDDFKRINDSGGHDAGDLALRAVASILATSVRDDDTVARIGGDEFAVILQNVTLTQAGRRMAELVAMVNQTKDQAAGVTISCGVAEYSAGDTAHSLLKRADEALYEAKRQGKGRAVGREAPLIRDLRNK